jgi:hypothetical protein
MMNGRSPARQATVVEMEPCKTNDLYDFRLGETVPRHRMLGFRETESPEGDKAPSGGKI